MNSRMSVRIARMRDGVDQSVDTVVTPITSPANASLGRVSECTPLSADIADRHDTTTRPTGDHISGTHP